MDVFELIKSQTNATDEEIKVAYNKHKDVMNTILELNNIEIPVAKVATTDIEKLREILKEKEEIFFQVKEHIKKST